MTGANGTGKTTLARAFAQAKDIPYVSTSATPVYAMLGLDPAADYPITQRLAIQEAVLTAFEAQWADATKRTPLWICDRTPIDLATYMLADVQRSTFAQHSPEVAKLVLDYKRRCIAAANRWFSIIVLVQPGVVAPVVRNGKAMSCPAYQEHFNAIALGLIRDEEIGIKNFYLPRRVVSLRGRVDALANVVGKSYTDHQATVLNSGLTLH